MNWPFHNHNEIRLLLGHVMTVFIFFVALFVVYPAKTL